MPTLREYQVTGVNRLRNHSDCIHGHMCAADAASFAIVVLRHFVKVKKKDFFHSSFVFCSPINISVRFVIDLV